MPVAIDPDSLYKNIGIAATAPTLAVDTEGNAKDVREGADPDAYTMGVSLGHRSAVSQGKPVSDYYPYRHKYGNLPESSLRPLRTLIETHNRLIFHNAKHDIAALANLGIRVPRSNYYDTMLMATWVDENLPSKALDAVSRHYGGNPKNRSKEMQIIIKGMGWEYIPVEMMYEYAANDAQITLELFENIYPQFKKEGYDGELWDTERKFIDVIMKMESIGIAIDKEVCEEETYYGELAMDEIRGILGLNPASPKDLEELLINRLGLRVEAYTDGGKPSFDKKAMEGYEEQLQSMEWNGKESETAALILEFRGWQKTVSSNYRAYLDLVSPDGRLRPNFNLHRARTGRLSCSKPNLQQIPRESNKRWNGNLKKAFIARPGYKLWGFDYANIELRMAAVYSQDENLLGVFQSGQKPFYAMAEQMFGPNYTPENVATTKTFTYATLYGAGLAKIAETMRTTEYAAEKVRDSFYGSYPGLRRVSNRASALAAHRGYVKLWTGRRRHFPRGEGAHKAFNSILQGGGAELVKRVMINLAGVIDWDECKMLLQIHDEVVFEIAIGTEEKWIPIIKEVMEDVASLNDSFGIIPFLVAGKNWGS